MPNIIEQLTSEVLRDYVITEPSGAIRFIIQQPKAKEPFSGSTNTTHTFETQMEGFAISNDGLADLTFTISGATYTVKSGEVFSAFFDAFRTVTVTTAVAFRAYGLLISTTSTTTVVTPAADLTAPENVTNLIANNVLAGSLTLFWTASVSGDVLYYDIYRGATLIASTTGTSYDVTGLSGMTTYLFTVKARDSVNTSSGTTIAQTTPLDTIAPANVTGLVASNELATSLTLSWTASTSGDIEAYQVFRGSTLLTTTSATTYAVTGLTDSTQYTFTVKAVDTSNNVSSGTTLTLTTPVPDVTPPANVTGLTVSNLSGTTLTLSWTASVSSDISSYQIFEGSTLLGTTSVTTYAVTGLLETTSYTFTVKSKDISDNVSTGASVTTTTTDITAPANVTGLTVSNVNPTTLTLSWTASVSADIASYQVLRGSTLLTTTSATTYNVTGLTASTAYTFTVKSKDTSNNVSTGTSVTQTTQVAGFMSISDDFNRADSTASLGTATTGQAWTVYKHGSNSTTPVFGIKGRRAYWVSGQAGHLQFAGFNLGSSNGTIEAVLSSMGSGGYMGFMVRSTSAMSGIRITVHENAKPPVAAITSDGTALVDSGTPINIRIGDRVKVVCSGATINIYVNGVLGSVFTDTRASSTIEAGTVWGLLPHVSTVQQWDSFRLTTVVETDGSTTFSTTRPAAPTGLTMLTYSESSVDLSWTASTDTVIGYDVVYLVGSRLNSTLVTGTTFTATGTFAPNYPFRVHAISDNGNVSVASNEVKQETMAP